jgi:uncharacterized membrane protein
VFGSSYGRILSHWGVVPKGSALDVSNALLGILFYVAALLHDRLGGVLPASPQVVLLVAATGALAFSAYLAYILNVVLRDICVVCTSMYICNAIIWAAAAAQLWAGTRGHSKTA